MTKAARNNLLIILILGALSTITPISIDMYLPSFTQIAVGIHSTVAKVSLSLSSYFVGYSLGQILYGPLLDRYGRKKPLYAGLILFILASVGCMESRTVASLIVFRFIQALGGCAAQVAAMAMVRDFFPVRESARIFSLLILILGVSPLFAPTVGSFITLHFGWQAVFVVLISVVSLLLAVLFLFLPEAHTSDPGISLKPLPIIKNFLLILREPQFYTYAFSGSLAFAGLLVYVAGSPIIFMHVFRVSAQTYGAIFAFLSVGFIGSNQVNILLLRRFSSELIFRGALLMQCLIASLFLLVALCGILSLISTLLFFFVLLSCLGLTYPNAAALALAPFSRNAGSASALVGFLQIGFGATASGCIGIFNSQTILPILVILSVSSILGFLVLLWGERFITVPIEVESHTPLAH